MRRNSRIVTIIRPSSILPIAEYMPSGVWIVITQKKHLRLSLFYHHGQEISETSVESPMGVVNLPIKGIAFNDYITLPAFHNFD